MMKSSFQKYMNAQSVFLQKKAEKESITIIEAVEKYGEYFREQYTRRFEKIKDVEEEHINRC